MYFEHITATVLCIWFDFSWCARLRVGHETAKKSESIIVLSPNNCGCDSAKQHIGNIYAIVVSVFLLIIFKRDMKYSQLLEVCMMVLVHICLFFSFWYFSVYSSHFGTFLSILQWIWLNYTKINLAITRLIDLYTYRLIDI